MDKIDQVSAFTFSVRMVSSIQVVSRVIELFALRDDPLHALTLSTDGRGQILTITVPSLTPARADVVAWKMRNIVGVEAVAVAADDTNYTGTVRDQQVLDVP
ncbi:hypothetical protein [Sphingomonas carotinifaciens]|nr:hypothetical protein [Sphingomonas carotinifaciens]MBB4087510.1 hypothetical protein [Sphingomonas carotinifaciens]